MNNSVRGMIRDAAFMIAVLAAMYLINFAIQEVFETHTMIAAIFVLGVFIISMKTEGYFWGILASLLCVFIVNFTFTAPYYAFNFTIPENLASALVMLVVSIMTSAMNTKVKIQEKLKRETEQERMRANLLRAISHDLRTPLTSIYGSTSTVIQHYDMLDKARKLQLLDEVRNDADWLIRMVENLLSVTLMGYGNVQIAKTPLEELLESVLVKFRKRYPNQKVHVSLPDEFIMIPMDAMLIEQVLINLLENAMMHAVGMQNLWINVRISENNAIVEVADDGCGLTSEQLEKIFTGSVKSDSKLLDGRRNSMGIGMPVCNAIIKAHGGTISAKNREGGGTAICFVLEIEEVNLEQ